MVKNNSLIKNIDHIGIAVKSIQHSLPFYTEVLGLDLKHIETIVAERVNVAFLKVGDIYLELLEPLTNESTIQTFIDKSGEGIHHISFSVRDIHDTFCILKHADILLTTDNIIQGANQANIFFAHPRDTFGVLYEFSQHIKHFEAGDFNPH